ncbi:exonuclease SbcCD subunit D [Qipengyuania sp.]|uniref:metallophosphoesterase family protein n=1 Tax=Qipengyuania sp. TaxID=2004515 RepID=UPI003734F27E
MTTRPFRVIHSSDWHIGHELHGHDRAEEHDAFFAWLIGELVRREADGLVVTGDVFDVANPSVPAMERFYRFLREATSACADLHIVVVGGNHDSAARINLPGALLGRGRVHLVGCLPRIERALDFDRLLVPLPRRDGTTAAWVAAVPYCRPGDLGQGDLASLYGEVLATAEARCAGLPLVLTGHLHVAGGDVSIDSERRIVIGGEEAEAASLFDARAAYVALGHLHRPQVVKGTTAIRYAGSPFPMSASERGYKHSIAVVDLSPGGVHVEEVPIPRLAPFLALPESGARPIAEVEALLAVFDFGEPTTPGAQPFVEVSVLLDRPEHGLAARVAAALADKPVRLTRVQPVYPDGGGGGGGIAARAEALAELEHEHVFAELYRQKHGREPEADLAEAFERLLIEVQSEDVA